MVYKESNWEILADKRTLTNKRSGGQNSKSYTNIHSEFDYKNQQKSQPLSPNDNPKITFPEENYIDLKHLDRELSETVNSFQQEHNTQKEDINKLRKEIKQMLQFSCETRSADQNENNVVTPALSLTQEVQRLNNKVKKDEAKEKFLEEVEDLQSNGNVGQIAVQAFIKERDCALEALRQEENGHRESDLLNQALRDQVEELQVENAELKQRESHRKRLMKEVAEMSELLEESKVMIERESNRHKECKEKLRKVENELTEAKDLGKNSSELDRYVQSVNAEYEQLKAENKSLLSKMSKLEENVNDQNTDLKDAIKKYSKGMQHEDITKMHTYIERLEEELDDVTNEKEMVTNQLKFAMEEVNKMANFVSKHMDEVQSLQNEYYALESEKNELKKVVEVLHYQLGLASKETPDDRPHIPYEEYQAVTEKLQEEIQNHAMTKQKLQEIENSQSFRVAKKPLQPKVVATVGRRSSDPKRSTAKATSISSKVSGGSLDKKLPTDRRVTDIPKVQKSLSLASEGTQEVKDKGKSRKFETHHPLPMQKKKSMEMSMSVEKDTGKKSTETEKINYKDRYENQLKKNDELQSLLKELHATLASQVNQFEKSKKLKTIKHLSVKPFEDPKRDEGLVQKRHELSEEEIDVFKFNPWDKRLDKKRLGRLSEPSSIQPSTDYVYFSKNMSSTSHSRDRPKHKIINSDLSIESCRLQRPEYSPETASDVDEAKATKKTAQWEKCFWQAHKHNLDVAVEKRDRKMRRCSSLIDCNHRLLRDPNRPYYKFGDGTIKQHHLSSVGVRGLSKAVQVVK